MSPPLSFTPSVVRALCALSSPPWEEVTPTLVFERDEKTIQVTPKAGLVCLDGDQTLSGMTRAQFAQLLDSDSSAPPSPSRSRVQISIAMAAIDEQVLALKAQFKSLKACRAHLKDEMSSIRKRDSELTPGLSKKNVRGSSRSLKQSRSLRLQQQKAAAAADPSSEKELDDDEEVEDDMLVAISKSIKKDSKDKKDAKSKDKKAERSLQKTSSVKSFKKVTKKDAAEKKAVEKKKVAEKKTDVFGKDDENASSNAFATVKKREVFPEVKKSDPFAETNKSHPFPDTPTKTDPFSETSTKADPFPESTKPTDPFNETKTKTVDPFSETVPFPEAKKADPFPETKPKIADPFSEPDTKKADPFPETKSKEADPFAETTTKTVDPFPARETEAKKADPFPETKTKSTGPFPDDKGTNGFGDATEDVFYDAEAFPVSTNSNVFPVSEADETDVFAEAKKKSNGFADTGVFPESKEANGFSQSNKPDVFAQPKKAPSRTSRGFTASVPEINNSDVFAEPAAVIPKSKEAVSQPKKANGFGEPFSLNMKPELFAESIKPKAAPTKKPEPLAFVDDKKVDAKLKAQVFGEDKNHKPFMTHKSADPFFKQPVVKKADPFNPVKKPEPFIKYAKSAPAPVPVQKVAASVSPLDTPSVSNDASKVLMAPKSAPIIAPKAASSPTVLISSPLTPLADIKVESVIDEESLTRGLKVSDGSRDRSIRAADGSKDRSIPNTQVVDAEVKPRDVKVTKDFSKERRGIRRQKGERKSSTGHLAASGVPADQAEKRRAMLEKERIERVEKERLERVEKEKIRAEKERIEREKKEKERIERGKKEKERARRRAEEDARILKKVEEEKRLREMEEEQERLREIAKEEKRLREIAEEEERIRKMLEEEERLRVKLEEENRAREKLAEERRLREKAEEEKRMAEKKAEEQRLMKKLQEEARLRKQIEDEQRLKEEAEEKERIRIKMEEEEQKLLEEKRARARAEEEKRKKFEEEKLAKEKAEKHRIMEEKRAEEERRTRERAKLEKEEKRKAKKREEEKAKLEKKKKKEAKKADEGGKRHGFNISRRNIFAFASGKHNSHGGASGANEEFDAMDISRKSIDMSRRSMDAMSVVMDTPDEGELDDLGDLGGDNDKASSSEGSGEGAGLGAVMQRGKVGNAIEYLMPLSAHSLLNGIDTSNLECLTVTSDGRNAIYSSTDGFLYSDGRGGLSDSILKALRLSTSSPVSLCLGSFGRYYIKFANGSEVWSRQSDLDKDVERGNVTKVAFGDCDDTYVVQYNDGSLRWCNIREELEEIFSSTQYADLLEAISLGPNGEYFVRDANNAIAYGCENENTRNFLDSIDSARLKDVMFGSGGSVIVRCAL